MKKRALRRRKKQQTAEELRKWLIANPPLDVGGRPPKQALKYIRKPFAEEMRGLGLYCTKVLLTEGKNGKVYLRHYKHFRSMNGRKGFPIGRFVKVDDECSWWEIWRYNAAIVLDWLYERGYVEFSTSLLSSAKREYDKLYTEITTSLETIVPDDVLSTVETKLKEKQSD